MQRPHRLPLPAGELASPPALGEAEVHVWTVNLEVVETGRFDDPRVLAPTEHDRAARFKSPIDRQRFVQRRCILREVLAAYLGIASRDLAFSANSFGKPSIVAGRTGCGLSFNASNSGALVAIAVARCGCIGIDIERLRSLDDADQLASQFFAPAEAAALAALGPQDRVAGFFNAWTRKEALVKGLGRGLSIPLDSFEVTLRPGEPAAILRWEIPGASSQPWHLHHFEPCVGYAGALAADFEVCSRPCRAWPAG